MQTAIEASSDQLPAIVRSEERLFGTRVVARPQPFSDQAIEVILPPGKTLADIYFDSGLPDRYIRYYQCWLHDERHPGKEVYVPLEKWDLVRPKAGIIVCFRPMPFGGAGGKGALPLVLKAVIAVIAAVTTALTWGSLGPFWASALGASIPAPGTFVIGRSIPLIGNSNDSSRSHHNAYRCGSLPG
jgi:hypothetical protein